MNTNEHAGRTTATTSHRSGSTSPAAAAQPALRPSAAPRPHVRTCCCRPAPRPALPAALPQALQGRAKVRPKVHRQGPGLLARRRRAAQDHLQRTQVRPRHGHTPRQQKGGPCPRVSSHPRLHHGDRQLGPAEERAGLDPRRRLAGASPAPEEREPERRERARRRRSAAGGAARRTCSERDPVALPTRSCATTLLCVRLSAGPQPAHLRLDPLAPPAAQHADRERGQACQAAPAAQHALGHGLPCGDA